MALTHEQQQHLELKRIVAALQEILIRLDAGCHDLAAIHVQHALDVLSEKSGDEIPILDVRKLHH